MGIRYYGWAVTSDEVDEAMDDPWAVIRRADQRHDESGWTNTCFDKAWCLMQRLFAPDWRSSRPAYDLVAGDVTYPNGPADGYEPHIGVLTRDRVRAVARDLAAVTPGDLNELCSQFCYDDKERRRAEEDYLAHYLIEAKNFTADAAARGHGIIYLIG